MRLCTSEALEVANRLGLVSPDGVVGLKASSVRSWFDKDPVLLAQAQEVRAKLDSCYRAGKVTVGAMLDCSGYLVTPRILASCLGGSQREDGRSDIEAVPAMRETCTGMMPDADSWECFG